MGSGKRTHAQNIADKYGYAYISTSQVLAEASE